MIETPSRKKYRLSRAAVCQPPEDSTHRLIPLTQNQVALVDKEDFEYLSQWNWCARWSPDVNGFYAMRRQGKEVVGMHSLLCPCAPGYVPDHVDGNTLNNQRANLQRLTHALNITKGRRCTVNTTGVKGVSIDRGRGGFMATFRRKILGRFKTVEEAASARIKAEHAAFEGLQNPFLPSPI